MKLYYYLLYKVFRFRMATETKALGSRATRRAADTAGLMFIPFLGWSTYGLIKALRLLTNTGIIYNSASQELWFMIIIGVEGAAIYWINHRLLKSNRWNLIGLNLLDTPQPGAG